MLIFQFITHVIFQSAQFFQSVLPQGYNWIVSSFSLRLPLLKDSVYVAEKNPQSISLR